MPVSEVRPAEGVRPRCKCGELCAYYGPVGGYSVKCEACNAKNAARQRKAQRYAMAEPAHIGGGNYIPPLIANLMKELPKPGEPMSAQRRTLWVRAFESLLVVLYPEKAERTADGA